MKVCDNLSDLSFDLTPTGVPSIQKLHGEAKTLWGSSWLNWRVFGVSCVIVTPHLTGGLFGMRDARGGFKFTYYTHRLHTSLVH